MKFGTNTLVDSAPAPKKFSVRYLYEYYLHEGIKERAPIFVAVLSVAIQHNNFWGFSENLEPLSPGYYRVLFGLIVISAFLSLFALTSRLGIVLFFATVACDFIPRWSELANHTYLALWTIPFAVFFKEWWKSDVYSLYLRVTLGIVMLAAFAQKLLAGTYIDGSYLYYLSYHGALTERMFSFACAGATGVPCIYIKIVSNFILLWQLAVGILLLLGVRSLVFLAIEIGFLLGAGLYADEMNFQVLNIALLCLVFRVGMPIWLLVTCITLLFIDTFTISYLLELLVRHAV